MNIPHALLEELEKCNFGVSTDTRKDVARSIYFAIKGENFDGNVYVREALKKGALGAVTSDATITGENIYLVDDVVKTLQAVAQTYRKRFTIPLIVIGGSNGKTTSKELVREVLKTKYKVHASKENFNNEIGVPLSILSMNTNTDVGVFEIGATHIGEHTELMDILSPTIVIVTNNGLDHLEGFGSPLGVRKANKEIYDYVLSHSGKAFVNKNHQDLLEDSENLERILYPSFELRITRSNPLAVEWEGKKYVTHLVGDYNLENIQLALAVGTHFEIEADRALNAICQYLPALKRSQFVKENNVGFVIDCYNANPSSMRLSLKSFLHSIPHPRGIILGDMLELGSYAPEEHSKIVDYISKEKLDCAVFIGDNFKVALENVPFIRYWFPDSLTAGEWFKNQKFDGFTFLLKGSRGMAVEKVLNFSLENSAL